jgi:hypothetical protein
MAKPGALSTKRPPAGRNKAAPHRTVQSQRQIAVPLAL